jgi:hypothetical protein
MDPLSSGDYASYHLRLLFPSLSSVGGSVKLTDDLFEKLELTAS